MGETIIVYGREGCPACENTMRALTIAGVPARYVDLDAEPAAAELLRAAGVQQLPYVQLPDGDSWTGLRLDRIVDVRRTRLAAA